MIIDTVLDQEGALREIKSDEGKCKIIIKRLKCKQGLTFAKDYFKIKIIVIMEQI